MLSVEFDEALGIVRCRIEGFLSIEEVKAVVHSTRLAKRRCMQKYEDVKMLVVTDGQVQTAEAMELVGAQRAETLGPYDRRAFVLQTSLQKLQVNRIFNAEFERCFISEEEAVAWLLDDRKVRGTGPPL